MDHRAGKLNKPSVAADKHAAKMKETAWASPYRFLLNCQHNFVMEFKNIVTDSGLFYLEESGTVSFVPSGSKR